MQRYKEKTDLRKIRSVSGYAWLFLVINQEEVGTRLGLTRAWARHLPMFMEYIELEAHRYKKAYIYQRLADRYGMHRDSVKRVILRLLRVTEV